MEEKIRAALEAVPDAYDDFVDGYCQDLKGDRKKQEKVLEYLKANPNAQTDDVMEYVDDEVLGLFEKYN